MSDLLQEYFDSRGLALRVDRQTGVIRGIKVLGLRSRNGREYLPEALARAVGLYEGAKVNVNHPKGHPLAPRDYQERIGVIRNVAHRPGEGLFADFHFNPKHYLSEQLMWDAEHAPESVGFSHNVQARTRRQGEKTQVEEIMQVHSVDLVADPATTRGLFEEISTADIVPKAEAGTQFNERTELESETGTTEFDSCKTKGNAANLAASREISTAEATNSCQEQAAEIARLQQEIDQLRTKEAMQERRTMLRTLLAEYRLPDPDAADQQAKAIVSDTFVHSLLSASDEQTMSALIEERAALVIHANAWRGATAAARRPISRDQFVMDTERVVNGKTFAKAITI